MDSGPVSDGALFCFYPASFWPWCWPLSTGRRILIRALSSRGKSVLMGKNVGGKGPSHAPERISLSLSLSLSHPPVSLSLSLYFHSYFYFYDYLRPFPLDIFYWSMHIKEKEHSLLKNTTSYRHSVELVHSAAWISFLYFIWFRPFFYSSILFFLFCSPPPFLTHFAPAFLPRSVDSVSFPPFERFGDGVSSFRYFSFASRWSFDACPLFTTVFISSRIVLISFHGHLIPWF